MDLRQLRLTQAPRTTKGIIFLLVGFQVAIGAFCSYLFLQSDATRLELIQAAAYALGAGVPLFALALILATVRSGFRAIENKITEIFVDLIPKKLSQLDLCYHDFSQSMIEYRGRRLRASRLKPKHVPAKVAVSLTGNASNAYYSVEATHFDKHLKLWLTVDLKLSQATICLFVPSSNLATGQSISDYCPSTLHGARTSGGYVVDPVEISESIGGSPMRKLILRREFVSDEFLWNSSATYAFISDLVLMIASFMKECAPLLATNPEGSSSIAQPAVTPPAQA
ncbi:MAG: hypothetical protein CVV14_05790 [Gammaproteobacteria bacterium HGW-Gammaproteobacteria-4]|jgi:hypothetical protein|nr:MAG: hypothetical protein CVV14_05790 [Gammaproteobacteria bacterium HGW-Gammaproteobacteria-4]